MNFKIILLTFSVIVASLVASASYAAQKNNILVFGDSLSAAYNMSQNQGWVALLQDRLTKQDFKTQVVNASISGETTSGGLSRFADAIKTHKPAIVILELGGNDGLRGLSASETYNNLDAMITKAKPAKVLLLGMKIPPNYGLKYSLQFSQNYEKLAQKHSTNLVPFFLQNVAGKRDLIQDDGLHPNPKAQPILLENIWPTLTKMLAK